MGELTPVALADFWTALDYVPVVLLLVGCYAVARSRSRAVTVLWATLRQVGRHRRATVVGVGLAAGLIAVVVSSARPPIPLIQDEFSYLLAADTLAHGRVTNPTHPHWQHFETFQVIHEPTYMSKYPPAQGLMLGLGQWLTGQALTGVWISTALAAAAVCWMLQGWVPGRWALLGSVFLLANVTIHITWGQTFWGGQAALLGGALVYGALPRILGGRGLPATLALVTGVAILANSRPFEGLVVSLPAGLALLVWFAGRDGPSMVFRVTRVILPGCVLLACVALAAATWNGLSHYYAPALAPAWLVIVQGLRQINLGQIDERPLGRYLVPGLLVTQVVIFTVVASAYVSRELNYRPEPVLRPSQARARIQGDLLFKYFEDRQVWWLYHDGHDWQVSAHKAAKSPASAQRESKRTSSRSTISIAGRPDAAMLRASSLMRSRSAVSTPGAP